MMWAIVPLKSPEHAKSRLAAALAPEARRALYFDLARRMLQSLRDVSGIDAVAVVTASDVVAEFAERLGARVLRAPADEGTARACAFGLSQLATMNADGVLMISGDLPHVSTAALEQLLDEAPENGVAIVPDRRGEGTNALLCRPANALEPCFGPDSLARHLEQARRRELPVRICAIDALALDLDVPEDLAFLAASGARAASVEALAA